jgi:hypothetical protein
MFRNLVRWIKSRKMLSDDLISLITLDPFRSTIPAGDVTLAIQE